MKKRKITTLLLSASLLCGCSAASSAPSSSEKPVEIYKNMSVTEDIFDTTYAYQEAPKTEESEENYKNSLKMLKEYNDLFDIYNDYEGINNLKTINDNAGKEPVKVDQRIIDMLNSAKSFYELSDGAFDITIGSVLKIWHNYRTEGIDLNTAGKLAPVPSKEELEAVRSAKGWDKIEINDEEDTVFITDPDVSIDVGAIAKGYAAEQVASALQIKGISGGFVNVGRNIRLLGEKIGGTDWNIGIADPSGKTSSIAVLRVDPNMSVVTSGDYERFYYGEDGKAYPHIVDPETLFPADLYHSVTIVTDDSGAADCLSTTLFTLSVEDGKKILDKYREKTGKTVHAVWVMDPDKPQNENVEMISGYAVTYTDSLKGSIVWN